MSTLLIALMIVLYTAQSFVCKLYSDRYPGAAADASPVFSAVSGLTVALLTLAVGGFAPASAGETYLLGVLNGAVLIGYNFFLIAASGKGPYSVLMTFSLSGGILVPVLFLGIVLGDPVSPGKLAAIGVMVVAALLICSRGGAREKLTPPFLGLCAGLFLCNGLYGSLLSLQQRRTGDGDREMMIAVTFGIAAVASALTLLVRHRRDVFCAYRQTRASALWLILCSLICAAAVNVLTAIIPLVDTAVLYSFDNAGVLLLSMVASAVFFRERLKVRNIVGGLLMCVALFFVSGT